MTKTLLEVEALDAWYGESHVLHKIDISVRQGEIVTLLGRNGAGRTTTLRSVMGILRKRKGRVMFKGVDLLSAPLHRAARLGLGYIPDNRGIFAGLSVYENLMLPPRFGGIALTVEEIYQLFPNLQAHSKSAGNKLSGGEQQMLAIGRILRSGADVLLLDEPTEGLAPVLVQSIKDAINELKKRGMTILLVEQNVRFARDISDRFYVMENGSVIDHFDKESYDVKQETLRRVLGV